MAQSIETKINILCSALLSPDFVIDDFSNQYLYMSKQLKKSVSWSIFAYKKK